jgi:hypothetical protein
VREVVFSGDTRRLMDMRRTGNVEAVVGGAQPTDLAAKLSNTLSQSNSIHETYSPVQLVSAGEKGRPGTRDRPRAVSGRGDPRAKREQKSEFSHYSAGFGVGTALKTIADEEGKWLRLSTCWKWRERRDLNPRPPA